MDCVLVGVSDHLLIDFWEDIKALLVFQSLNKYLEDQLMVMGERSQVSWTFLSDFFLQSTNWKSSMFRGYFKLNNNEQIMKTSQFCRQLCYSVSSLQNSTKTPWKVSLLVWLTTRTYSGGRWGGSGGCEVWWSWWSLLQVMIIGPPDTLYEGGFFKCHLYFPTEYPLRPPVLKWVTRQKTRQCDIIILPSDS